MPSVICDCMDLRCLLEVIAAFSCVDQEYVELPMLPKVMSKVHNIFLLQVKHFLDHVEYC